MRVRTGYEPVARWHNLRLPRVALLGCLMTCTAYPALAQTTWTDAAGNDDWFDAGNWDTSAVPDASTSIEVDPSNAVISGNAAEGDNVTIRSGGTVTVTGTGSTLTTTETRTDGERSLSRMAALSPAAAASSVELLLSQAPTLAAMHQPGSTTTISRSAMAGPAH